MTTHTKYKPKNKDMKHKDLFLKKLDQIIALSKHAKKDVKAGDEDELKRQLFRISNRVEGITNRIGQDW